MRVEIHGAGDHQVVIDAENGDLDEVIGRAAKLFHDTRSPEVKPVPAFGFDAREVTAPDPDVRNFDEVTLTVGRSDA